MAELADARHSKCRSHKECRFDPDRPHHDGRMPSGSEILVDPPAGLSAVGAGISHLCAASGKLTPVKPQHRPLRSR